MEAREIVGRAAYNVGDEFFKTIKQDEYLRMLDWTYRTFAEQTRLIHGVIGFLTIAGQKEYTLYGTVANLFESTGEEQKNILTGVTSAGAVIALNPSFTTYYFTTGDYVVHVRAYDSNGNDVTVSVIKTPSTVTFAPADTCTIEYTIEAVTQNNADTVFGDNILAFRFVEYNGKQAGEADFTHIKNYAHAVEGIFTTPIEGDPVPNLVQYAIQQLHEFKVMHFAHTPADNDEVILHYTELPRIKTVRSMTFVPKLDLTYHPDLVTGVEVLAYSRLERLSAFGRSGLNRSGLTRFWNDKKKEKAEEWRVRIREIVTQNMGFKDENTALIQGIGLPFSDDYYFDDFDTVSAE